MASRNRSLRVEWTLHVWHFLSKSWNHSIRSEGNRSVQRKSPTCRKSSLGAIQLVWTRFNIRQYNSFYVVCRWRNCQQNNILCILAYLITVNSFKFAEVPFRGLRKDSIFRICKLGDHIFIRWQIFAEFFNFVAWYAPLDPR
jgi:hypothetical protein